MSFDSKFLIETLVAGTTDYLTKIGFNLSETQINNLIHKKRSWLLNYCLFKVC